MDNRAIGVFDSGLGGLTVVRQLIDQLPGEDVVYFGDTGRVPYGTRSRETIERYTRQDCRFLQSRNVKMIIAACGTVSSVAPHILEKLPLPAIGVVEAAADAAVAASKNRRIGVIGTAATVRSGSFERRIKAAAADAEVTAIACPLFVPLVENGWIEPDNPVTRQTAAVYLRPLREAGVDTLILGCTHFPLLAPIIAQVLPGVTLIDSGKEAARRCAVILRQQDLLADRPTGGKHRYCVSDHAADFSRVASMFLGQPVQADTEWVGLEEIETPPEAL
ncbi:MAG: glutamate racemase [Acutalibacteraceae bacterium]|jgi:glutamate racemase